MTLPFTFPDWMPPWMQLIVVVAALLVGLTYLAMPFAVFGVKSRIDGLDARLDDMQSELRNLSARLPEPMRGPYDPPAMLRAAAAAAAARPEPAPPPIPAASWQADPPAPASEPPRVISPTLRAAARLGDAARERSEPKLGRRPFS